MRHYCTVWIGLLVVGLAMLAAPCLAAQATAQAGATICPGLAITNVKGLEFGVIAPEAAGNVVVSPSGSRTASGGLKLLDSGDTEFAAEFAVAGAIGATYSVGLPSTISITCGSHTMTVGEFAASPAGNLAGGSEVLRVGATLAVEANQPPGRYTGSFEVTVNYN